MFRIWRESKSCLQLVMTTQCTEHFPLGSYICMNVKGLQEEWHISELKCVWGTAQPLSVSWLRVSEHICSGTQGLRDDSYYKKELKYQWCITLVPKWKVFKSFWSFSVRPAIAKWRLLFPCRWLSSLHALYVQTWKGRSGWKVTCRSVQSKLQQVK